MSAVTPWLSRDDLNQMRGALAGIIASWADTLLWLQHIDAATAGATPGPDWDAVRQQVVTSSGATFGRGWQLSGRMGYLPAVPLVGGIWNDSTFETVTDAGIVLYSGAVLVYQATVPVRKFDIIVDPADKTIDPGGTRYAVGDELANVEAFGASVYRYASLEDRSVDDPIYSVPLI